MIMNPKISVIIPVYKVENYIRKSVDSVIEQTYSNIEIILVDDGSPDNCPKICDEYSQKYDNIIVVHKSNGGLSDARNHGMNCATGEYVLFLDSDDFLEKTAIENMVDMAVKNNYDAVLPDRYYKVYENDGQKYQNLHFDEKCYYENPLDFAIEVIIGKGRNWRATAILYRFSVIKQNSIQFPVGYVSEDFLFNLKFMKQAEKLGFYKFPTLYCLKRTGSISNTFHDEYFNTILFIDEHSQAFADEIKDISDIQEKVDSLYCRNIFVYFISIYKSCLKLQEKSEMLNSILNHKRTKEAMKSKFIVPYFEKKSIVLLIKLIYILVKLKLNSILKLLLMLVCSRQRRG